MRKWKEVVIVIKKEDLLSEIPDKEDFISAWYGYTKELELDPFDFEVKGLKSRSREFKKTWHITLKFRRKGEWWEYED